jgi:hypothetical protein
MNKFTHPVVQQPPIQPASDVIKKSREDIMRERLQPTRNVFTRTNNAVPAPNATPPIPVPKSSVPGVKPKDSQPFPFIPSTQSTQPMVNNFPMRTAPVNPAPFPAPYPAPSTVPTLPLTKSKSTDLPQSAKPSFPTNYATGTTLSSPSSAPTLKKQPSIDSSPIPPTPNTPKAAPTISATASVKLPPSPEKPSAVNNMKAYVPPPLIPLEELMNTSTETPLKSKVGVNSVSKFCALSVNLRC